MASKKTKFATGLFVLSGLMIGAVIIIWIGASDIFLKGSLYSIYFDESVQGLQVDSPVKYRGVEIGKVEDIRVAPDNELIEVDVKISLPPVLQSKVYAQLKAAGITGMVFIELDRIQPDSVPEFIQVPFNPDTPFIPSRRSETSRFLQDADTILQNIKAIDFAGLSNQIQNSARAIENLLTDRRLNDILASLESSSRNLDGASAELNEKLSAFETKGVMNDLSVALAEMRGLITSARRQIEGMQLPRQAARAGEVIETLDQSSKSIAVDMRETTENLRVASERLKELAERLKNNPTELIFSSPLPPRKEME